MATAYMFNMPYHGHINPCLALIQELARRGDRIVFYGMERFRSAAEASGAEFRVFEHEETEKSIALTTMAEWQMQTCERTLDQLVCDARTDPPDYLIVDYTCLWGRFLSQHLQVPTVVVHTTCPVPHSRAYLAYRGARELVRVSGQWRKLLAFRRADRRISRRWGVARIKLPFNLLYAEYGDLHLVLASREMASHPERVPSAYQFVGPCVRTPGVSGGVTLPPLDDRPLLYVSIGTFWTHPSEIYRAIIEAFREAPIQVLITGSHHIAPDILAALPPNFHVRSHVDQIEVLGRANAFITHGGMNSVTEALMAKVPMLVYPIGFDQFLQARYVEAAGAGLSLANIPLSPEVLRRSVDRLLRDDTMRINCAFIARQLREAGGAARAADLISAKTRRGDHERRSSTSHTFRQRMVR